MSAPLANAIPLRRERVDAPRLVASSLTALIAQAEPHGIDVRISVLGGSLPLGFVDPDKTAWAVATLVGSAMRYVRVATAQGAEGSIVVQLGHEQGANELWIAVHDELPSACTSCRKRTERRIKMA